jgi:hypothetical protein
MFSFCKPVSSKKRFSPYRKINDDYTFTLFGKAADIPHAQWSSITCNNTVFLEKDYLQILERSENTRLGCRYVIVYRRSKPCGIIYFQIVDFKAGIFGSLMTSQLDNLRERRMNLFERYLDSNREEVLMRLFTCGNNLVSGEYGFLFAESIKEKTRNELVLNITDLVAKEEKLRGTISAILLKDFYDPLRPATLPENEKYSDFFVEPNMVVEIPKQVETLEDYIGLFAKKYRNRARSILRSVAGTETRYLTLADIERNENGIYRLYEEVFEKAKFRLMKLPLDYFSAVKKLYPDNFIIKAYFENGTMVAFLSAFILPAGVVEAHYIGFKYEANLRLDLYQNILYAVINEGISHKCRRVNLGRTAAEIKTTVGARPFNLICYIKPQNTISRLIQRPFISFLQPAKWTPRNPFREEKSEG